MYDKVRWWCTWNQVAITSYKNIYIYTHKRTSLSCIGKRTKRFGFSFNKGSSRNRPASSVFLSTEINVCLTARSESNGGAPLVDTGSRDCSIVLWGWQRRRSKQLYTRAPPIKGGGLHRRPQRPTATNQGWMNHLLGRIEKSTEHPLLSYSIKKR